jgi:hypothetical protein
MRPGIVPITSPGESFEVEEVSVKRTVTALAVITALAVGVTAQASASTQRVGGCPASSSGYTLWDVSTQPYQADNAVDAKGNGDGSVCAKPVDSKTFQDGGQTYPVYSFIDNITGSG